MIRSLVFVLAALIVPLAASSAQQCLGGNSFDHGKLVLGGQGQFSDGYKRFAAVGAYGMPKSWFASATIGSTSFDGGGDSQIDFGGSLGYQFDLSDNPFQICPIASLGYASVGNFKVTSYGIGGGIGYHADVSDDFILHPAIGLALTGSSVSYSGSGTSSKGSSNSTLLWANIGLIANKQWAIIPGIMKDTEKGSKVVFSIVVTYSIP